MTGMRNVVYLDHLGLANERLILAHCVWLDAEEKRILRDRGVHVSHCPGSNLKLASGIADTPGMLQDHIHLSLGADGAPCNNNLDMFNEMRLAAVIQKPHHGPTTMDARSVFRMATIGGAKAVGMEDQIGSIEVGKKPTWPSSTSTTSTPSRPMMSIQSPGLSTPPPAPMSRQRLLTVRF